jgi:hypothetical protein
LRRTGRRMVTMSRMSDVSTSSGSDYCIRTYETVCRDKDGYGASVGCSHPGWGMFRRGERSMIADETVQTWYQQTYGGQQPQQ